MSKAREIGTEGENFFLGMLRRVFGDKVERAALKGIHDHGDYVNVPWLFEAKHTLKPCFEAWARAARRKSKLEWWTVMWKPRDLRKKGAEPLIVIDKAQYECLLAAWAKGGWQA